MNTNNSRGFVRFVAGPIAAAAILGVLRRVWPQSS
jgi:hypothetical protein